MNTRVSVLVRALTFAAGTVAAWPSHASGSFQDSVAHFLAVFIIIALPIGGVVLFWLVHILPEKAAEKRHHPQKDAIQVLCLLSLVFGGLLWPLAWLWAYTKPVLHQVAYGRDKHDDYYKGKENEASSVRDEVGLLRQEIDALEKGESPAEALQVVRARLARLESQLADAGAADERAV